jgi:hypothetical protein
MGGIGDAGFSLNSDAQAEARNTARLDPDSCAFVTFVAKPRRRRRAFAVTAEWWGPGGSCRQEGLVGYRPAAACWAVA